MATDTDICNLALSYLGDAATLTSIDPPEGSAQASHCARFYPIARDQVLEMHDWGFSMRRVALAYTDNPSTTWKYAYAGPADALRYVAVLPPDAPDDYSVAVPMPYAMAPLPERGLGPYIPQPFAIEASLIDGSDIVLTNQDDAVLRYTVSINDTAKFSPLCVEAIARLLASKLAGPLLKGDEGRKEARAQLQLFTVAMSRAQTVEANQRKINLAHSPTWMTAR
jgi:hypothetical protein